MPEERISFKIEVNNQWFDVEISDPSKRLHVTSDALPELIKSFLENTSTIYGKNHPGDTTFLKRMQICQLFLDEAPSLDPANPEPTLSPVELSYALQSKDLSSSNEEETISLGSPAPSSTALTVSDSFAPLRTLASKVATAVAERFKEPPKTTPKAPNKTLNPLPPQSKPVVTITPSPAPVPASSKPALHAAPTAKPPAGLVNPGNNCFMNSLLTLLFNSEGTNDWIRDSLERLCKKNSRTLPSYEQAEKAVSDYKSIYEAYNKGLQTMLDNLVKEEALGLEPPSTSLSKNKQTLYKEALTAFRNDVLPLLDSYVKASIKNDQASVTTQLTSIRGKCKTFYQAAHGFPILSTQTEAQKKEVAAYEAKIVKPLPTLLKKAPEPLSSNATQLMSHQCQNACADFILNCLMAYKTNPAQINTKDRNNLIRFALICFIQSSGISSRLPISTTQEDSTELLVPLIEALEKIPDVSPAPFVVIVKELRTRTDQNGVTDPTKVVPVHIDSASNPLPLAYLSINSESFRNQTADTLQTVIDNAWTNDHTEIYNETTKQNTDTLKAQTVLINPPEELLFALARFPSPNEKIKYCPPCESLTLTLPVYDETLQTESKQLYNITGFVSHLGSSITSGHYISYKKIENSWYQLNNFSVVGPLSQTAIQAALCGINPVDGYDSTTKAPIIQTDTVLSDNIAQSTGSSNETPYLFHLTKAV